MARQALLLVALALLATVSFAADAPVATPDKPKPGLPTFAAMAPGTAAPTAADNDEVGTVSGGNDAAPAAGGPSNSIADALAAGLGGPVSSKTFGTAEAPESGATTAKVSAGAAVAAIAIAAAAASFF